MNELKKSNINQLVNEYNLEKDQTILEECYTQLVKEYRRWIDFRSKNTFMANNHDITAIFDDVFLGVLSDIEEKGGDFVKLFQLRLGSRYNSFLRKLVKKRDKEKLIISAVKNGEEEAATFEIADELNLAEEVTERLSGKKKNDQRMLIEFLVSGENERTTAIVQTYLSTELKSPTAIGKQLGLDHKQVTRALNRLAGKFSTKQFGDYNDYLIAL
jgi:hypothetical protein